MKITTTQPGGEKPRRPPLRRRGAARAIQDHRAEPLADSVGLIEHPDGWYWVAPDGHQQFGPFSTCSQARADRDRPSVESMDEAATEREAEVDLGVVEAIEDARVDIDDVPRDGGW